MLQRQGISMGMDAGLVAANDIVAEVGQRFLELETEEDAKLQIIVRIMTEALGWPHGSMLAERAHETGYSDLIFRDGDRNALLIEAKRLGRLEVSVADKSKHRTVKLSSPALKKCKDAIEQAAGYAGPSGLPVAVVTDGVNWIIFKPHVSGEHYYDKEGFIFPSLEAVLVSFNVFYELISYESTQKKLYNILFDEIHNPRILLKDPLKAAFPESSIIREQKSQLAFDLDKVFDTFFSRMTGENDPVMLVECFVETRESRIADFTLEKMTAQVLGNIDPSNQDIGQQLSRLIGAAVDEEEGENIFIVGPTGAGKSTFLTRFFQKTLSSEVRDRVVPLRLNFLSASGSVDTVQLWMTNDLIRQIEADIYPDGSPTWEQLRGLYWGEYHRRSRGVDAKLYSQDKDAFQRKFSEYMDNQVETDREGYLRRLLTDLVSNRKKLPVLILDNSDEFGMPFKEAIFQFSQSLRRHVKHCMVIMPLTDKSTWLFSKSEMFNIYRSKSFFLPTPAPREVFRKRIDYLRAKIEVNDTAAGSKIYLAGKGIRVSIPNLERFAEVLEQHFVNEDYISRIIGEMVNYNIRAALGLARRIMTSAVLGIESVLSAYAANGQRPITRKKFLNALLKGDHNMYRSGDIPEIVNLFQADDRIAHSPLLAVRILALLRAADNAARDVDGRHLSVGSIQNYFEVCGCAEVAIDTQIKYLTDNKLIERFDPSSSELTIDQKLAITHAGRAHLHLAMNEHVYFEQMALTTGLTSQDDADLIRAAFQGRDRLDIRFATVRSAFARYLMREDAKQMSIPSGSTQFLIQKSVEKDVEAFITIHEIAASDPEMGEEAFESAEDSTMKTVENTSVTLDWFSYRKGYGFADCAEVEGQVFIHADALRSSGIVSLRDGDILACDIQFTRKGPHVSRIHRVTTRASDVISERCRVIRVFSGRAYGFVRPVHIVNDEQDAFFHFSALHSIDMEEISEGAILDVEINMDPSGRGRQVGRIVKFVSED